MLMKNHPAQPAYKDCLAGLLNEIEAMKTFGSNARHSLERMESHVRKLVRSLAVEARGESSGLAGALPRTHGTVLTTREQEAFCLIGKGYTRKEIARLLSLSIKTVGSHIENIKNKLSIESSADLREAARLALSRHDRKTGA